MDPEEASLVEDRLRQIAVSAGLGWVLDEYERTVDAGVSAARDVDTRSSTTQSPSSPERPGRRRKQEFLTQRQLTPVERVTVLALALRRALVDLPEIATATLDLLAIEESTNAINPPLQVTFTAPRDDRTVSLREVSAPDIRLSHAFDRLIGLAV